MSSPFLAEPVAQWESLLLHTHTLVCCKYNYKATHTVPQIAPKLSVINGIEPSWELQILL